MNKKTIGAICAVGSGLVVGISSVIALVVAKRVEDVVDQLVDVALETFDNMDVVFQHEVDRVFEEIIEHYDD